MADDGTAFLRQAGDVQHRCGAPFKMRGHSQDGADGDYATAAYAGDQNVAIAFGLGKNGLRQLCDQIVQALPVSRLRVRRLARLSAQRSEERRVGKECVSTCRSRWWPSH